MKKKAFLCLFLLTATMRPTDIDTMTSETLSAESTAIQTQPLTDQSILISIIEQVVPCKHARITYMKKYEHLLNATLTQLQDTNLKAYDALMTPIIENQAGILALELAQEKIKNTLSKKNLAYQLFTNIQNRYLQDLETAYRQTAKINATLDEKYQYMHRQLQLSTIATIIVGYLQTSKLLGYKVWPLFKAHKKTAAA